jgi:hypothetical protein
LTDKEQDALLLMLITKQRIPNPGFMKKYQAHYFIIFSLFLATSFLLSGCFSRLPDKYYVYFNDFEGGSLEDLSVFDRFGKIDSLKIAPFNNGKVFGFFNNNRIEFVVGNLPDHNTVKIEFDLLIHDRWDGNHLVPGGTVPDIWRMVLDNQLVYVTTFSNGPYQQAFPGNYIDAASPSNPPNPARANSWRSDLPGVCALQSQSNGTSLYKIELTTGHTAGSVFIACNDALQPLNSHCAKSWSIDNLRLTAIKYN